MTRILRQLLLALSVAMVLPGSAAGQAQYVLKFATLAPPGTAWMKLLEEWGREVKRRSGGRLVFKFYPGGVQGDEPDVLRKMHFDQLQGGAFTGYGIGRIYSPARVLELPFLFHDVGEIDFVRQHFMPAFRKGFHEHGYELLGWMEVGFIHMFSRKPIRSIEDMKSQRVWLWQGDPIGQAFFKASGISPVPLSIMDVYTSLSTGLIDTVYAPPLGAIALQWFTRTKYVSTVPLTNGIGALVVTRRFFGRLPPDLQSLLRETGAAIGERLIATTRTDNEKSLEELKRRGLVFVEPDEGMSEKVLTELRDRAARSLIDSDYIPASVFDETRHLLEQYRSQHGGGAAQP
ncbi:MAG TPA: ABC transporter substrate-binding protein [Gammaproteobacteria bacterium]|nr:ABC transporter substrate-binding protein [Gammaproteobacteria bacterium]